MYYFNVYILPGNFRIPRTMLVDTNGVRADANIKYPKKGKMLITNKSISRFVQ